MQRRDLIVTAGVLGLAGAMPLRARAEQSELTFGIFRNDDRIGHHVMQFTRNGSDIEVDIDIELKVKIAFITVYAYKHNNNERWSGGRLAGFDTKTDDDGDLFEVHAAREGEQIRVRSLESETMAPGTAVGTTYWDRRFLDGRAWISTQDGKLVRSSVTSLGPDSVPALGGKILPADRFRVEGDLTMDLWYDESQWAKLTFPDGHGSTIEYRLETATPLPDPFA